MSVPPGQSPTSPGPSDPKAVNRARFELELEFIQALANPYYLHSLAQQNIFEQPAFVNYLKYLLYWKEKDYARFLQCVFISLPRDVAAGQQSKAADILDTSYPQALHHLELLQHPQFRADMKKDEFLRDYLQQKQFDHWRTWRDPKYTNPSDSSPIEEASADKQVPVT